MPIAPGITPAAMPGAPPRPPRPLTPPAAPEPGPEEVRVPLGVTVLPPFTPIPDGPAMPQPPRPPMLALSREQHMRRIALELAVKHHADLECTPEQVLAVAKTWAIWIRTGTNAP